MVVLSSLIILLILPSLFLTQYIVTDEASYLANFDNLIAASYTEPLPTDITSNCANKGNAIINQNVSITSDMTATELLSRCNINTRCIIEQGVTVTMDTDLNIGVLEVSGTLLWTDITQTNQEQYLCSGYILFNPYSVLNITVTQKKAYIYIKNNGVYNDQFGQRFLVAERPTYLDIIGREMRRYWSLLAKDFIMGGNSITLMHNASEMGWQVGDRIAIAPTAMMATQDSQYFFINSINGYVLQLSSDSNLENNAIANQNFTGQPGTIQAEVINLSRNILITGDDFQNIPCGTGECACDPTIERTQCTLGLHTMFYGNAVYRVENIKVEKCGQRGILARYCLHFHQALDCVGCIAHGNVVEHSHQRGITIHGSDVVMVSHNVVYDVRGVGIYIEDGNELYNNFEYNVIICPWSFYGPLAGCTVPGTDNLEADTAINQAGIWSLDHTNNFIGNRATNGFNGLFFEPSFQNAGRGFVLNEVCTQNTPLGRVIGNTNHGCGRFGTYFVEYNWPRHIPGSIATDGVTGLNCPAFDVDGNELGFSATIVDNVDYHNQFVGSYAMGDIQMYRHTSFDSMNIIYSKETKNFADGCSAHYKDSVFQSPGAMLLADGAATTLFERVTFIGDILLQANHHCGLGVTGLLCNPVYMFYNPTWQISSVQWVDWLEEDISGIASNNVNMLNGGMFVLSPDDIPNTSNNVFPSGYVSLASGAFTYLLDLPDISAGSGNICTDSRTIGLGQRYNNGTLCKETLRRLNIYSLNYTAANRGITLKIEVFNYATNELITEGQMPFQYTTDVKQGFGIAVIPDLSYLYVVSQQDGTGIPLTWIIEFSDPIVGNRWTPDQIRLQVTGRTCPAITTSQHDRRFIWGDSLDNIFLQRDRGACTEFPDMPVVNCNTAPILAPLTCPDMCTENCTSMNAFCDCGLQACKCEPGFYGPNCEFDICADSRCQNGGKCAAKYLGGDISLKSDACICVPPYAGVACESNPCEGVTCGGQGNCLTTGPNSYTCVCNPPWSGENCDKSCDGLCVGVYPYMCSLTQPYGFCKIGVYESCNYQNQTNDPTFCCMYNCYACEDVICPTPDNDCYEAAACVNGICPPPIQRPDGSICHSQSWGTCQNGQCVQGQPPTSLPSQITSQQNQPSSQQNQPSSQQNQPSSQQNQPSQKSSQESQTKSQSPINSNTENIQPNSNQYFTSTQKNSTYQQANGTDYENNLSKIDSQLEPWKLGLIVAGSSVGVAIIVGALVVMLKPSIRTRLFVKHKDILN